MAANAAIQSRPQVRSDMMLGGMTAHAGLAKPIHSVVHLYVAL